MSGFASVSISLDWLTQLPVACSFCPCCRSYFTRVFQAENSDAAQQRPKALAVPTACHSVQVDCQLQSLSLEHIKQLLVKLGLDMAQDRECDWDNAVETYEELDVRFVYRLHQSLWQNKLLVVCGCVIH